MPFAPYSDCEFSPCGKYRPWLIRVWSELGPLGCIIGKNPSLAGKDKNDQTMHKDIAFGKSWGWCGVLKVNLSDYISTDPKDLLRIPYSQWVSAQGSVAAVIGEIQRREVGQVVCAWGTSTNRTLSQRFRERGEMMKSALVAAGIQPYILRLNADGTPAHTLWLPKDLRPIPWF